MSIFKCLQWRVLVPSIFFACYLLLGAKIYTHYGVSVDEGLERANGMVSLVYVGNYLDVSKIKDDPYIANYRDVKLEDWWARHYPVGFTVPAILLEKALHLNDEQQVFYFRHLLTFLVCFLGVIAVFRLAERRFNDWRIGLLAALFLILSPRFFAESFYNSKDVVLMSWFAIALNSMVGFVLKPSWSRLIFHAIVSAIAIDIRLMALIFPLATACLVVLRVLQSKILASKAFLMIALYFVLIAIFVVISWPYLWVDPFNRLIEALGYMARLNFPVQSLYLGEIYASNQLPWHYLPVWVAITTPPLYSFLFLVGTFSVCKESLGNIWRALLSENILQDYIFLLFFWAPMMAIIIRGATLYDGWRHAYFIYPAFILMSIRGFVGFIYVRNFKNVISLGVVLMTAISLLTTAAWMKRNHPYQNVYFNFLAGHNWKDRFDVDYWGLSNRQALEFILDHDDRKSIKVISQNPVLMPLEMAKILLSASQKSRIQVLSNTDELSSADYLITNYRLSGHQDQDGRFELIYQIVVGKEVIVSIFKRKS